LRNSSMHLWKSALGAPKASKSNGTGIPT